MPDTFDLAASGFKTDGRIMDNGERRASLTAPDGSGYVYTDTGARGEWQNAHHHQGLLETYIVQRGWIAVAENGPAGRTITIYEAGESFTSRPGIDHNIYMSANTSIHTVKHGTPVPNPEKKSGADWYAASESFDRWTKSITDSDLAELL